MSSEVAKRPNLGCSLTASLQVQKPETSLTLLTVLLTDVDRWEGHSDNAGPRLRYSVCISGASQGGTDNGWLEMLVVVRCRRANIVDKVRMNLGKNKTSYWGRMYLVRPSLLSFSLLKTSNDSKVVLKASQRHEGMFATHTTGFLSWA